MEVFALTKTTMSRSPFSVELFRLNDPRQVVHLYLLSYRYSIFSGGDRYLIGWAEKPQMDAIGEIVDSQPTNITENHKEFG